MGSAQEQSISLSDPLTGLPLGPGIAVKDLGQTGCLAFRPAGRVLAAGDQVRVVRFWNVPAPVTGPPAEVGCRVEMTSRTELFTEPAEIIQYTDRAVRVGIQARRTHPAQNGPPGWARKSSSRPLGAAEHEEAGAGGQALGGHSHRLLDGRREHGPGMS